QESARPGTAQDPARSGTDQDVAVSGLALRSGAATADSAPASDPAPGIHAWRFDPALVEALDALFAGNAPEPMSSSAPTQLVPDGSKPLSPRERGWGEGTSATEAPDP
ncbi:hypothetical protein LN449_05695, partial [Xanthomonas cannabis]|nr:hypothetical protein [Xanthomonas cannabis]